MNYYENIKEELINNEIYKKVKDYSKNKNELETNLKYMRQFYFFEEKSHAVRDKLTWTHYRSLLKLQNIDERI